MDVSIRKLNAGENSLTKQFNRKSAVTSRLLLAIEHEKLTYSIVPVEPPYEREVQLEETDYGFSGQSLPRFSLPKWMANSPVVSAC